MIIKIVKNCEKCNIPRLNKNHCSIIKMSNDWCCYCIIGKFGPVTRINDENEYIKNIIHNDNFYNLILQLENIELYFP